MATPGPPASSGGGTGAPETGPLISALQAQSAKSSAEAEDRVSATLSEKKNASHRESAAALPAQARAGNSRRPRWRSRVHPGERRQTNIRLDTPRRRRRERWRQVPVAKQRGRPREDCLPRLSEGSRRQIRDYARNSTLHRGRDTRMRGAKWDAGPLEPMWQSTRRARRRRGRHLRLRERSRRQYGDRITFYTRHRRSMTRRRRPGSGAWGH